MDVPFADIADQLADLTTARLEETALVEGRWRRPVEMRLTTLVDFRAGTRFSIVETNGEQFEQLQTGGQVYHRLTQQEQRETGRIWRQVPVECPYCPHWERQWAGFIVALRTVARPVAHAVEAGNDRYTFLIRPRKSASDPMLAELYKHLRYHYTARVIYDVWLDAEGRLTGFRESWTMLRFGRWEGSLRSVVVDFREFGTPVEFSAPTPDEVLHDSA
ncbi:hypothetical protein DPM19_23720 [Actinomadura craniellae]|uniref:Uncharacterized protein n=1 Tax=Actinomadura craniellae TaxID=2231787 RepID=A0A365H0L6_9ACTN|nr:hypothetical protein DPM19_23720 [Actinomadura craniellae]